MECFNSRSRISNSRAVFESKNTLSVIPFRYLFNYFSRVLIFYISLFCFLDTSLVSVSDTEILQLDLNFLSSNLGQMAPTESSYSVTPIGRASSSCCFQCAAVSRNRQQLAVATSNDNILLYSVPEASQITDFSGHTG